MSDLAAIPQTIDQVPNSADADALRTAVPELPRLVIEPLSFELDLAEVKAGRATREFTVKNEGRGELVVSQLVTSCGCTGATITKNHLAPGDSASVNVSIKPSVFTDNRVIVTLVSNDSRSPQRQVTVAWQAAPPLQITPKQLNFGLLKPGESADREIHLERFNGAPEGGEPPGDLVLKDANPSSAFGLRVEPLGDFRYRVAVTAGEEMGRFDTEVHATTGGKQAASTTVLLEVRPDVWAVPGKLALFVQSGAEIERSLVLRSRESGPVVVTDVKSEPADWLTGFTSETLDRVTEVKTRLRIASEKPNERGRLLITTMHGDLVQETSVPVVAVTTGSGGP